MRVLYIIFLVLTLLIGLPTVLYGVKLLMKNRKVTAKTQGTRSGYHVEEVGSFFTNLEKVACPTYQFKVAGSWHTANLEFARVKVVDEPEKARVVIQRNGKPSRVARLYKDKIENIVDDTPIEKAFPMDSKATVYYDPNDPDNNYVLRRKGNTTFNIFLAVTVLNIALTVLFRSLSH